MSDISSLNILRQSKKKLSKNCLCSSLLSTLLGITLLKSFNFLTTLKKSWSIKILLDFIAADLLEPRFRLCNAIAIFFRRKASYFFAIAYASLNALSR